MSAPRKVQPEWLDELPASDPRAVRSRADLRRLNRIIGSVGIVARALDRCVPAETPPWLLELGAGDGSFALALARSRCRRWPRAALTLLDMRPSVAPRTLGRLRALGWTTDVIDAEAVAWLEHARAQGGPQPVEGVADGGRPVIYANLFVHHFDGERLTQLLAGIAGCADAFVCCEPRRAPLAMAGSRMLRLIGANDVTRHDALISVRAGFAGTELTGAWLRACGYRAEDWRIEERSAGLFSHLFVARRVR